MFWNRKKTIYITETLFDLDGSDYCNLILENQITYKKTVENVGGLALIFKNEKLIKATEYEYNNGFFYSKERELKSNEIELQIPNYQPHKIIRYKENENGIHQIGGYFSDEFLQPENNCIAPFQYLGFIDNKDKFFDWLPFKVHLTCPIFLDFEEIFLDYSNPQKPVIINRNEVEKLTTAYDEELNQNSYIKYKSKRFNFIEDDKFSLEEIQSGLPRWIQGIHIPKCPKTGKRMRYLCQMYGGTETEETNIAGRDDWYQHYFEQMDFWGSGDLYVFFEPDSKVACYFIQNT